MKYPLLAAMLALSATFPSLADVLTMKKDAPKQYVVKKGDTLWGISGIYLQEPWQWPELWQMNPQINNPHLIYPGDALSLIYDEHGNPRLVINQGYKKLSPHGRIVQKDKNAIPTLPLELLRPYLTYEQALNADDIADKPYILGANVNTKMNTEGHIVYVKGELKLHESYAIYRKGDTYVDPQTHEVLANKAQLVAVGRVFRKGDIANGVPASVKVEQVKREVKAGDFLMPAIEGQLLPAYFNIHRPEQPVQGEIIASVTGLREFSTMDIVVLNLGAQQQIKEGHILDIERQSPTVFDGRNGPRYKEDSNSLEKLVTNANEFFGVEADADTTVWHMPKEQVGQLMVFKVYKNVSYALIVKNQHPIRVGDFAVIN
ncbi:LysM peptidoglycan-binding domain-containing protein [Pseudoalteromonas arctica]|uniref:LysM peptidoglycan-binding domain-containing protein n=1 Tax=Pseudoalteromonas arctica TaxID=394751 RepID=A0A7Y0DVR5_9GAMM|nr:LysM domain-containing protein [Pseudoalteromonas arctica]NMM42490.1 LysM peptidoglycan-binding domain-containing protein [Pseudoalteromonas arctica]